MREGRPAVTPGRLELHDSHGRSSDVLRPSFGGRSVQTHSSRASEDESGEEGGKEERRARQGEKSLSFPENNGENTTNNFQFSIRLSLARGKEEGKKGQGRGTRGGNRTTDGRAGPDDVGLNSTLSLTFQEPRERFCGTREYRVSKRNAARKREGKLNTSQAGSVAASRAAVGQFLSISREAFILRTR